MVPAADGRGPEVTSQPQAMAPRPFKYRPLRSLATGLAWLLGVAAFLDAVAVASDLVELGILNRISSGAPVTLEEAAGSDNRQATIRLLQLGMLAGTGVVFIVWLHRAYTNLLSLGAGTLRFARGWAIWAWIVPIWGLFRPKQIINDVWRGSDPERPDDVHRWDQPVPRWWVVWWLAFLLSGVFGGTWLPEEPSLTELKLASSRTLVSDSLSLIAAVLAVFVVLGATRRQQLRVDMIARSTVGSPDAI